MSDGFSTQSLFERTQCTRGFAERHHRKHLLNSKNSRILDSLPPSHLRWSHINHAWPTCLSGRLGQSRTFSQHPEAASSNHQLNKFTFTDAIALHYLSSTTAKNIKLSDCIIDPRTCPSNSLGPSFLGNMPGQPSGNVGAVLDGICNALAGGQSKIVVSLPHEGLV
jgi:hypothetical protein